MVFTLQSHRQDLVASAVDVEVQWKLGDEHALLLRWLFDLKAVSFAVESKECCSKERVIAELVPQTCSLIRPHCSGRPFLLPGGWARRLRHMPECETRGLHLRQLLRRGLAIQEGVPGMQQARKPSRPAPRIQSSAAIGACQP